jgi:hypothetical protein
MNEDLNIIEKNGLRQMVMSFVKISRDIVQVTKSNIMLTGLMNG